MKKPVLIAGFVLAGIICLIFGLKGKYLPMPDNWQPVAEEPGLFWRDFGGICAYRLQMTIGSREYIDLLGMLPLEQARLARDILRHNREAGTGPQSWTALQAQNLLAAGAKKPGITFGAYFRDRFWPMRLGRGPRDEENKHIEGRWRNYLKNVFGARAMEELTAAELEKFAADLRARDVGQVTIQRCIADLRRMWNRALKEGVLERGFPGRRLLDLLPPGQVKQGRLKPWEAALLLKTAHSRRLVSRNAHDVWAYVALGLGLGMRAVEIHALTLRDVKDLLARAGGDASGAAIRAMIEERLELYGPASPDEPLFRPAMPKKKGIGIRQAVPRGFADLIRELGFNETAERRGDRAAKIDFDALRRTWAEAGGLHLHDLP